jgi:NADH-quinone oxidoreductase subunit C/D
MPWMNKVSADRVKQEFKDIEVEHTEHTTNLHVKKEKLLELLSFLKNKEGYRHFIDFFLHRFSRQKGTLSGSMHTL